MDRVEPLGGRVMLHPHCVPGVSGVVTRPEVRRIAASAYGLRFADRAEMRRLSSLGVTLSATLPQTRRNLDARAQALAVHGNALRISGDYGTARSILTEARETWEVGVRSHATGGFVAEVRASLFEATRESRRALSELEAAEAHARARKRGLGKVLLQRGLVYASAGDGSGALRQYGLAIDHGGAGVVLRSALLSIASVLAEVGDWQGAQYTLERVRRTVRRWPRGTALRVPWIRARIAHLSGSPRAAEDLYLSTLRELVSIGAPHEAALVSIDLARLYMEDGRIGESHEAARRAGMLLISVPGAPEAMAARILAEVCRERLAAELVSVTASLFPLRRRA